MACRSMVDYLYVCLKIREVVIVPYYLFFFLSERCPMIKAVKYIDMTKVMNVRQRLHKLELVFIAG